MRRILVSLEFGVWSSEFAAFGDLCVTRCDGRQKKRRKRGRLLALIERLCRVPEMDSPPGAPVSARKSRSSVGRLVDGGQELIYIVVAALLLIAAAVTCGFAAIRAGQQFGIGKPLEGIFSLLNDLDLTLYGHEVVVQFSLG